MIATRFLAWLGAFAAAMVSFSSEAQIVPLSITQQPQSLSLYECQRAQFNVGWTGTAYSVAWYRDGVLVYESYPYFLPNRVTLSDNGAQFYAVVSNPLGSVTSSIATLTVTADPLPFRVVSAKSCSGPGSLLVSFATCPLNITNATNVLNYFLDGDPVMSSAVVNQGTNVLLTTLPLVNGASYTLTVINLDDSQGNILSPNPTDISFVAGAGTDFTITQQPSNKTVLHGASVTLQFAGQAVSTCFGTNVPVTYQWQQRYVTNSFTNVVGATDSTYSFYAYMPFCWGGDMEYRALAFANGLAVTSATATVRAYVDDGFPPFLQSARCTTLFSNRVTLTFRGFGHAPNQASATNPALYSINNGVTVLAARYGSNWIGPDYTEIVLTTTPLTNRAFYVVTVTNIQSSCEFPPEQIVFVNRAPVTLLGTHSLAGHNYIYIEAEDFDFNTSPAGNTWWRRNGSFVDGQVTTNFTLNSPRLDYAVNFPSAGIWYVWLRGKGYSVYYPPAGNVRAGLDGVPTMIAGNGNPGWNTTNWTWLTEQYSGRMLVTVGNTGPHAFSLWLDTFGASTAIDSILLTTDASFDISPRSMVWSNEVNCAGQPNPNPAACLWPPPRENVLDFRLQRRRAGASWELSWLDGGVLQFTTNLSRYPPSYQVYWYDVPDATNPMLLSNGPPRYFRVKFF